MRVCRLAARTPAEQVGEVQYSHGSPHDGTVSVFFNPVAGDAMVDATIKDVILKLGRKAELLQSKAIVSEKSVHGSQKTLGARSKRRGLRKPGAVAVLVGTGSASAAKARSGEGTSAEHASASAPKERTI